MALKQLKYFVMNVTKSNVSKIGLVCVVILASAGFIAQSSNVISYTSEVHSKELAKFVDNPVSGTLAIVTGYSSEESQTDSTPFLTAFNTKVREGIVANNCLKRGTTVKIEGSTFIVEDRMNKRYGCEYYDIWFSERESAINWGVRKLKIEINETD